MIYFFDVIDNFFLFQKYELFAFIQVHRSENKNGQFKKG